MSMELGRLIRLLDRVTVIGSIDHKITDIVYDSRKAHEGCLFCCIKGFKSDGHAFAGQAVAAGAKALCVDHPLELPESITQLVVPDTRASMAALAVEFFDHPADRLKVIGITGTNGKTTTTFLVEKILNDRSVTTGLIGTLYVKIKEKIETSKHTTPEAVDLQNLLHDMVDHGMEAVAMEVSSHALSLRRADFVAFDRAVFTNLTQDHLDFHHDLEDYFQAKLKLFTSFARYPHKRGNACAILNADDPFSVRIIEKLEVPYLTYGLADEKAHYRAIDVKVTPQGASYTLITPDGAIPVSLSISGIFNVYNSLAAITTAASLGIAPGEAAAAIRDFQGVKGRFEMVRKGQDFAVLVDYAHTPDGLLNILKAAREITRGKLIAVFGCGGDRDRTKRPVMGKIGALHADHVIITSDNPRTEVPESIVADIEVGVKEGGASYEKIVDRKAAIFKALSSAAPGDTVVIAGKGHENYQIFKDRTIHFDDVEVAEEFLCAPAGAAESKE